MYAIRSYYEFYYSSQFDNKDNTIRLLKSQRYKLRLEKRRAASEVVEADRKKIEWG